jgi:hypothetical protein
VIRKSWLRVVSVLMVAALVGAACGSDRDDEPSGTGGGDTTTTAGDGDGESASDTFGDLDDPPCGEGDASGATDQGVTDESILIGYGDDAGFPNSPGLNEEMSHAIEAFITWCNDLGGINGRQVEGRYLDAKIFEVNNRMLEACESVFMLVGQGWALDAGQEETRLGCNLPSVPTYSVSPAFAHGPLMVQPVPNPTDFTPTDLARYVAETHPEEAKRAAVMFANFAATQDTKDKVLSAYPQHGFEFLDCPQEYNVAGETDWRPFVQRLQSCDAQVVYFSGSPFPNFQNFLEAADQLDYDPYYVLEANFYVSDFAEWNTRGLADKVYIRTSYVPLEEAGDNPATQQYIDIVEADGGQISQLGQQAASAFLLWATAVKACGSDVTRDCVVGELEQITEWDGGGMHAPTNPADNMPSECGIVLSMEGTEFVRVHPEEEGELDCSPDNITEVTGPVVDRAQLGPDRVSTQYTG